MSVNDGWQGTSLQLNFNFFVGWTKTPELKDQLVMYEVVSPSIRVNSCEVVSGLVHSYKSADLL